MTNPYTLRPVITSGYYVASRGGRGQQALRLLQNITRADPLPDSISIVSERRFGKTSLLKYLLSASRDTPGLLRAFVDLLDLQPRSPQGFYNLLTRTLIQSDVLPTDALTLNPHSFGELLDEFEITGRRMVIFIDEFDLVASGQQFEPKFFDVLRSASTVKPLTLVVASVAPLSEIARSGVYTSPFSGIFNPERLGLLSVAEAEALVARGNFGSAGPAIIALAGRHPYFLQMACGTAWDLRAASGTLSIDELRAVFADKARAQYQYIWEHSSPPEQRVLRSLVSGARSVEAGIGKLIERGYVLATEPPQLFNEGMADFMRRRPQPDPEEPRRAQVGRQPGTRRRAPRKPMGINRAAPLRRLALVIGIDEYQYQQRGDYVLPPLRYARRDAVKLAVFLKRVCGFQVKLLLDCKATSSAVQAAFAEFGRLTADDPNPESCFVFHFSGHGEMDPNDDERAYLVLYDTDPSAPAGAGIEMEHLVNALLPEVRVPNSLVLLDACHAGCAAGVRNLRPAHRLSNVTELLFTKLPGRMVLAACAGAAQAREIATLKHGVFTYYVLRHWRDLDGTYPPGRITFASLWDYVGIGISENYPDLPKVVSSPGVAVGPSFVLRHLALS